MQTLERVLDPRRSSNRALRAVLALFAIGMAIASDLQHLLFVYPFGVDLEIPLRAAERWRSGAEPYLASAFLSPPGVTQPFLYPPWVLPPLSLLVDLPRPIVLGAWCLICIVSLAFICRRLAFPTWTWPLVALWPPILEPIIGGNVQLPVVAMFCAVFWISRRGRVIAIDPVERPLDQTERPGPGIGIVAAFSAAVKVSQPHTWVGVLRRAPRVALFGAFVVAFGAISTVPFTGLAIWGDWLAQLKRATDPTWELGGIAIARLVNPTIGLIVSVAAILVILLFLPQRRTGAWVGVLAVIGASSLHTFGTIFLLPAMLLVRRELALIAALLIATTTYEGTWAGIVIIGVAMTAGLHWQGWFEPHSGVDGRAYEPATGEGARASRA
jgi:hypothetical protein